MPPYEERVRRLEAELEAAHLAVILLMPGRVQALLRSYADCTQDQITGWLERVSQDVAQSAKEFPVEHERARLQRAYCPLCRAGSLGSAAPGFSIPQGLHRHLMGRGNQRQCVVMRAACELARTWWRREFRT